MHVRSNDSIINIPPPPTIKDLVRQEMRIQRNEDMDRRIAMVFETFAWVYVVGLTAYYFSLGNEEN